MSDIVAVIDDVRVKNLSDDRQLYIIKADGREYSTFKRELAASAKSMMNQKVKLDYVVKQNGDFTNYYLNGVESPEFKQAGVDARQIDIRRAVAIKAAIEMLPFFEKEQQNWNTVRDITPGIYQFLYGDDGNWESAGKPEDDFEGVPF